MMMMDLKESAGHDSSSASLVSSSSGGGSASSSDGEEDGWRSKLEKVCVAVGATDETCKMAWRLWELTCKPESVQSCAATLAVCLYIAGMKPLPIKVTQLLSELGVSFDDFYHAMRNMDAPSEMQLSLTTLNNQFQVVAAIYKKFQTMYGKIFNEDCGRCASPFPSMMAQECWTMFILAKGHGLQAGTDLVSAFHLLLCVLDHFVSRCQASSLHEPYASAVRDGKPASGRGAADTGGEADPAASSGEHSYSQGTAVVTTATPVVVVAPPVIALLCRHNNCNHEEVMSIHAGCFLPFLSSLPATTTDSLQLLSEQYGALYEQTRGIDERGFLLHHPTLVPNADKQPQALGSPTRSQDAMLGPQQTPIRTTMNTVQQLKLILNSASDEPSATLSSYLSRCSVNPRAEIARTVEEVGSRFQRNFVEATSAGCAGTAHQRLGLAVRLYYRVMEAILKSEEERLNIQDFSTLLGIETFHVSLLACSLEVVMATYNSSWSGSCGPMIGSPEDAGGVSFPWVLGVLSLSPYNFYKVLESFIRAETSLTRDVIKHLRCCEEAVLDSLAWQPDSPLLEELRNCRDGVHAGTDAAPDPHGAGINPGLNAVHAASALTRGSLSPVHHPSADEPTTAPSADQPAAAVQPGPPPGVASPLSRHRRSSLLFLKKVCCLAHQRLKQLCMDVHLLPGHAVQERTIWTLLEHTVRNEPDLMAGRHLDQIMMCAIYAICKVHNIDLKFKTIVTAYKGMPHAKQQTFKHVLIRENQYDSIIVFYNLVFMQQLKANILQFVSPHPPTLSPIPSAMLSPSSFRASPLRVPGRSNFYISPLKNPARSLASVPLTPKSRLLVCIGETIGSPQFQRINAVIGASGRGAKRRLVEEGGSGVGGHGGVARPQSKRLLFDCGEAGADETDGAKPHNGSGDALATNGRSRSIIHRKVSELAFAFQRTRKGDGGDHDDHDDK